VATRFDQSADGREVEIARGDEFEIALSENPTTGFRWRVASDGSPACALVSDDYGAPEEGRPGRPGLRVLRFRAGRAGGGEIRLINARAGAAAEAAGHTFALRVRVTQ
jgi:predicted secreted protein